MVTLTYADLTRRLTDLERLAEPPLSGEQGGACSSYDRRSRYNAETGAYEEWDANNDGSGFIRQEGDWIVAFERDGPGVIWRVWSALPSAGHIQIFIDDAPEPAVDMPFRDFFERYVWDSQRLPIAEYYGRLGIRLIEGSDGVPERFEIDSAATPAQRLLRDAWLGRKARAAS